MLNSRVLVLNRSWLAVHVTPVRRALSLLYQGHARAVHPTEYSLHTFKDWCELSQIVDHGYYIHTPSLKIRIPEVILLNYFNGFVRHEVRFSRQSIFERDGNRCQYCGRRFPKSQLTLDHVIPASRGGDESWENLVVACLGCNVKKANRTPKEAGMSLVRPPRRPSWMPQLGSGVPNERLGVWQRFVDTTYWKTDTRYYNTEP